MKKEYLDLVVSPERESLEVCETEETLEAIEADFGKYHVKRVILSPTRWKRYNNKTPLNWSVVKYEKHQKQKVPNDKGGVYTFVVTPNVGNHPYCSFIMYVGKTEKQTLQQRFMQYFQEEKRPKGGRPHVKSMLKKWQGYVWFCFAPIDDEGRIESVENDLISAFVPPVNRVYKGLLKEAIAAWMI
jgi:hypothetical protein